MMINKTYSGVLVFLFVLILISAFISPVLAIEPFGAAILNVSAPQRAPVSGPGSLSTAYAGNVSEVAISGYSVTQTWQGYYGNVTGTIQLADASNNVLYNWTLASPSGEVYASTNSTVTWSSIQCFNYTANGTQTGATGETPGATNLGGLNLSQIERMFNLSFDDVDGVNETFYLKNHDQFFTANLQFSVDECQSTRVYSASGPIDQQYEEVLLYEPNTRSIVFASLLEENAISGFNTANNDFEMLVLENGHGTDTTAITYYFFVELE